MTGLACRDTPCREWVPRLRFAPRRMTGLVVAPLRLPPRKTTGLVGMKTPLLSPAPGAAPRPSPPPVILREVAGSTPRETSRQAWVLRLRFAPR